MRGRRQYKAPGRSPVDLPSICGFLWGSVADTGAPVPGSVTAELFLLLARLPYFS